MLYFKHIHRERLTSIAAAVNGLLESSKAGPAEECYVRSVHALPDGAEIVVGLNPDLTVLLHSARWLMVDTNFDTNEWKSPYGQTVRGNMINC